MKSKLNYLSEINRHFGQPHFRGLPKVVSDGLHQSLKLFKKYKLSDNPILFDSYVDESFLWGDNFKKKVYNTPWVGIIHNPYYAQGENIPYGLNKLFANNNFKKSLKFCKGIFVFSQYNKEYLDEKTEINGLVPVNVLRYACLPPKFKFHFGKFKKNHTRKIIQIGSWLRNVDSIYKLGNLTHLKRGIMPFDAHLKRELSKLDTPKEEKVQKVQKIGRLNAYEYDQLLSQNIVFLDLQNSSGAESVIVDCVARNTPLLVNRLPAVEEYLGPNYPFYYETLEEAREKTNNIDLIGKTNRYLKGWTSKNNYSPEKMFQSIFQSEIYQAILIEEN